MISIGLFASNYSGNYSGLVWEHFTIVFPDNSKSFSGIGIANSGHGVATATYGTGFTGYIYFFYPGEAPIRITSAGSRYFVDCCIAEEGSYAYAIDGNNGKIYKSDDRGASRWVATTSPNAYWTKCKTSSSGVKTIACSDNAGIYLSEDYGSSWVQKTVAGLRVRVMGMSVDGDSLIVSGGGAIKVSNDFGTTWTALAGLPTAVSNILGVDISNSGEFIVFTSYSGIYLSSDYGLTFNLVLDFESGPYCTQCVLSNDGSVIAASGNFTTISVDFGNTWQNQTDVNGYLSLTGDGVKLALAGNADLFLTNIVY